jgi:rhodanese-related sulfurtransferase
VLVDVREAREWDDGHVQDAVLLPLSQIRAGISADELRQLLPKDQPIYLHCGAAGFSRAAESSQKF